MFLDTTWVDVDSLKEFLQERLGEVILHIKLEYLIFTELMKYLQEHARQRGWLHDV